MNLGNKSFTTCTIKLHTQLTNGPITKVTLLIRHRGVTLRCGSSQGLLRTARYLDLGFLFRARWLWPTSLRYRQVFHLHATNCSCLRYLDPFSPDNPPRLCNHTWWVQTTSSERYHLCKPCAVDQWLLTLDIRRDVVHTEEVDTSCPIFQCRICSKSGWVGWDLCRTVGPKLQSRYYGLLLARSIARSWTPPLSLNWITGLFFWDCVTLGGSPTLRSRLSVEHIMTPEDYSLLCHLSVPGVLGISDETFWL